MLSEIIKNIYFSLPKPLSAFILRKYENYFAYKTANQLNIEITRRINRPKNIKPKILFFDTAGGSHGGTAKEMQILAKYLDKNKYDVYFMCSTRQSADRVWVEGKLPEGDNSQRARALENFGVKLIDFQYESISQKFPYVIKGMNPDFFDIINKENIDLLIITTEGKSYFPSNLVRDIPIILLNVFGSYTVQKNIVYNICYTQELIKRIIRVVDKKIIKQMYIPCEKPPLDSKQNGILLRKSLGIKDNDVVFGRIGRNVDCIFDPIGINAFKIVVAKYPEAHFLIVSPPPALEKIVKDEKIPNVHFLPPTSIEKEIWAFHEANDVYAHFRRDGETFGLNIAEAMMCGKPIITHKSFMWNGHLEYLEPSFSRIAEMDNWQEYAKFMEEFIKLKNNNQIEKMGQLSKQKAEKEFFIGSVIKYFEKLIDSVKK